MVLRTLEAKLIYLPSPEEDGIWDPPGLDVENVFLQTDDSLRLHAWYCPCPEGIPNQITAGERPVLFFCHGNAGNLSHRAEKIAAYQRHFGADCFIFDYRGYGKSQGRPSEDGLYLDSRAAYRWLTEEKGIPSERIVLIGHSLGGAVALELALAARHRCLILQSAFTSLPDVATEVYPWLPARWIMFTRFDNRGRLPKYTQPVLIVHGTADTLIPVRHTQELFAIANEPKRLVEIQGAGHNDVMEFGGDIYFMQMRNFLRESFATSMQTGKNNGESSHSVQ